MWKNTSVRSKSSSARGQSLVEMALTLPIIMVFFVGMVEVVYAYRAYLVILDASSVGARIGAQGDLFYDNSEIQTMVLQNLAREGYNTAALVDIIIVRATISGNTVSAYAATNMMGSGRTPTLTQAVLLSRLKSGDPYARLVGVEVVYDHRQLLGFPIVSQVVPNPIALHAYTVQYVQR